MQNILAFTLSELKWLLKNVNEIDFPPPIPLGVGE